MDDKFIKYKELIKENIKHDYVTKTLICCSKNTKKKTNIICSIMNHLKILNIR